jgi:hypothetical protein
MANGRDGLSDGAQIGGRVKLLRRTVGHKKQRGRPIIAIFQIAQVPPCPSGSLGQPRFPGSVAIIPARSTLEWPAALISETAFEAARALFSAA